MNEATATNRVPSADALRASNSAGMPPGPTAGLYRDFGAAAVVVSAMTAQPA
jgi:hypothetical protein